MEDALEALGLRYRVCCHRPSKTINPIKILTHCTHSYIDLYLRHCKNPHISMYKLFRSVFLLYDETPLFCLSSYFTQHQQCNLAVLRYSVKLRFSSNKENLLYSSAKTYGIFTSSPFYSVKYGAIEITVEMFENVHIKRRRCVTLTCIVIFQVLTVFMGRPIMNINRIIAFVCYIDLLSVSLKRLFKSNG